MSGQKCCVCGADAPHVYLGKPYCEPHIAERTPRTETYSRVVGYLRPVQNWPDHKKNEFYLDRKTYAVAKMLPKEQLERLDVSGDPITAQ